MSPTGKHPLCTQGKEQDPQQTQNDLLWGRLLAGGSSQASLLGGINPMRSRSQGVVTLQHSERSLFQ